MYIVIIEDEDLAALALESLLKKSPFDIHIKAKLTSVKEATQWLKNNTCDLIFSDIELGDGESFDVFNSLDIKTPIIFTTAYDVYAIKSFNFYAIDYLLKPYDKKKLYKAVEKYINLNEKSTGLNNITNFLSSIQNSQKVKSRFLVYSGNQLIPVDINQISFFMAEGKNLFLYTNDGKDYLYDDTISNLEKTLDKSLFFKINRKYILNLNSIKNIVKYDNKRIQIQLNPPYNLKETIFVSNSKINDFKNWLNS